jgi:hypothetical protein
MPVINWHDPVTVEGKDLHRGMVVSYGNRIWVVMSVHYIEETWRKLGEFDVQAAALDGKGKYEPNLVHPYDSLSRGSVPCSDYKVIGSCDPEEERKLRSPPITNRSIFITIPIAIAIFFLLGRIGPGSHSSIGTYTVVPRLEYDVLGSLWLRSVLAFLIRN